MKKLYEPAMFAAVGAAASLVHFIAGVLLIEKAGLTAWIANIGAFAIAFPVSYFGHAFLTFQARAYGREAAVTRQSLARFFALATAGFALNQASIVLFVETLGYPHRIVLGVTIIGVAGLIYALGKFWAFRDRRAA